MLEREPRDGHRGERGRQAQRRKKRRQEDAAGRHAARRPRPTQPPGTPPRRARPTRDRTDRPAGPRRCRGRARPASRRMTPYSGRRMKSCCSRLSATVACTSTPANSVSSGVDTTSRVPRAVVPTNTILSLKLSAARLAAQNVGRRDVGEGAFGASIAQQQIALAVERHAFAPSSSNDDGVHVDHVEALTSRVPVVAATAASASEG